MVGPFGAKTHQIKGSTKKLSMPIPRIDMSEKGITASGAERGFTLVELLLITAVIGVLAAIAMPLLALYRQRSYDSQTVVDLKAAAMAEEAYFTQNSSYTDCIGTSSCETVLPNFKA